MQQTARPLALTRVPLSHHQDKRQTDVHLIWLSSQFILPQQIERMEFESFWTFVTKLSYGNFDSCKVNLAIFYAHLKPKRKWSCDEARLTKLLREYCFVSYHPIYTSATRVSWCRQATSLGPYMSAAYSLKRIRGDIKRRDVQQNKMKVSYEAQY